MADENLVEPKDETAVPAPAPDEEVQPEGEGESIPDDVLKIPAIQGLMVGKPPALSASIEEFAERPEAKLIAENKDTLEKAGMGLYRSMSGELGVLFNRFHIHPEAIKAADKAGKLQQVAPPFDQVNQELAGAGAAHPALSHDGSVPGGFAAAPQPQVPEQPPSAPVMAPAPAGVQKKVATARINAAAPGSPTSGPVPGAGRILNSILKNPV